ncbi:MAG: TraB/GumN family protein [Verrucomicrobia bacterium]|nr:TraB/GumN family protein [Verrucomicrobiota bacterium]
MSDRINGMNRKNPPAVSLVSLCLGLVLWALEGRAASGQHQEFLWVVTNRSATVYLLGSIHALRPLDYPLSAILDEAFAEARRVVFEIKYDELNSPLGLSYISSRSVYPNGETIQQHVSAETYQLLKNYQTETGASLNETHRPWYALALISNQEVKRLGYSDLLGVDRHYYDRAKAADKPILALETAAFQIDLLADVPAAEQENELRNLLSDRNGFGRGLNELVTTWKDGNLANLTQIIDKDRSQNPAAYARIFTDRNSRWLPQIEAWLKEETVTLVIVGAGHFVGDDSVVNLLRRKGHVVRQLPLLPTRLLGVARLGDGSAELNFDVIPGHHYAVESSEDFRNWKSVHEFVSSASTKSFLDVSARGQSHRVYRLKNLDEIVRP